MSFSQLRNYGTLLTGAREIIDESDVYIDVHKAIRRMAPAPKARAQNGNVVGNQENTTRRAPEDYLIDLSEGGVPMTKSLSLTNGERTSSPALFGTSPKTTFLRRSSSGADGNTITVRGNVNDMKEHLKHLGPSNLASRPKTTRYNTVKIKAGHPSSRTDSRTDSAPPHSSIIEEPYHDEPGLQGGEGEGLLRSAGRDAKDGVQAVQQGYGSFGPNSPKSSVNSAKKDEYTDGVAGGLSVSVDRINNPETPERPLSRQESNDSERSSDTLGALPGTSPTRKKRGAARSGSITENIIEAGGFRKVVLETTSSSSDDREEKSKENQKAKPQGTGFDGQADHHDDSEQQAAVKGEEVKKKRRRNRKKKSAKNAGEEGSGAAQ